jgi:hypothetical protein
MSAYARFDRLFQCVDRMAGRLKPGEIIENLSFEWRLRRFRKSTISRFGLGAVLNVG